MNRCLQGAHIPEWMTKRKTTLIQKDPSKGTATNNYRPITYVPKMRKKLTAQIKEEIYYSIISRGLFSEHQKVWRKGARSTAELLYIDQHILNESNIGRKNLAMAGINYKKVMISPAKLDNKLPQNVQNIKWSHKLYRENRKNLKRGIDCSRKKLSWSKEPKRYFSTRCTITVTIHNCHGVPLPLTQKMHSRMQT